MAPKYQIFVSSTYEDLKEHRDQAVKMILRIGHLPVGMEMFNAANSTQWEIIKRHIDNSDYYIVILAHRYGSMDEEGVSYTEKEYNYALAKGIPCLGFVIDKSVQWSPSLISTGEDAAKLAAFKEKIKSKMVSFWTSSDNLASNILSSLSEAFVTNPRIGWIRANEVTTSPLVAEELSRLSKRNEELTTQLALSKQAPDEVEEVFTILKHLHYALKSDAGPVEKTLLDIFLAACTTKHGIYPDSVLEELFGRQVEVSTEESDMEPAFQELLLLNLLDFVDSYDYRVTLKGKQVYTRMRHTLYQAS